MTVEKRETDSNFGLACVLFFCLLAVMGESAYLYRVGATLGEAIIGVMPVVVILLVCCGIYAALHRFRHVWARRIARLLVGLASLVAALTTLAASGGFWQTGSIPRIQQMHGLTWDILAPSIHEMTHKNASTIGLVLILALVELGLLWVGLRQARSRLRPIHLGFVGLLCLVLLVTSVFANQFGVGKYGGLIASRLFRYDLDLQAASSQSAQRAVAKFFRDYHLRLGQTEGSPPYPDILSKLRGSNVIWVVLESTRAKDVPLYGGSADMPNLMQARQHMLLLNHLYSQDPRSTKAFPQMDMGKFSLLSWDSYSNNIPWMFPEDGIASHLDKLGYQTASMVNSDESLDHNKSFQEHHGYQLVLYRQALNPGTSNADDMRMLDRVGKELDQVHKPFYMMVWPIETHHPYGREYWSNQSDWTDSHPEGIQHLGAADYVRYLQALHEVDDWFGQLIDMLKQKGEYENTVIIVTGDHGEAFGEHEPGNVFHGNGVYEESTHVTGFIYSPKIDGLHVEDRNVRLLDIPATILSLASDSEYLLNDGRSIFQSYKYEMPIYLFNSWAGAVGIIYDGHKLWHRESPGSPVYYASMAQIYKDAANERQVAGAGQGGELSAMLNKWEVVMKTRTAQLLTRKAAKQPPLNDVIRIYCDDGTGFRESFKDRTEITGLGGTITIPLDKSCRALRIAPIESTIIPKDESLDFHIEKLEIVADDRTWNLKDVKVAWSNNLQIIDNSEFKFPAGDVAFDYQLDSKNHPIQYVRMRVEYRWLSAQTESQ